MENQSTYRNLKYKDLGIIDYKEAWDLQKKVFNQRLNNEVSDTLFLLEHPHTYTLGKIADKHNLVASKEYLSKHNISVYEIDRGGDITYHGPGQVVGYPIINLSDWKEDTHKYLRGLEEVIINTCADYDLTVERKEELTGVWIEDRKICAIGIKVTRWITMHGFALNVNTDLSLFAGIIPCGIKNKSVTSLQKELNKEIDLQDVKKKLVKHFCDEFSYNQEVLIRGNEGYTVPV